MVNRADAAGRLRAGPLDSPSNEPGPVFRELKGKLARVVREGWQEPPMEVIVITKDSLLKVVRHLQAAWGFDALMDLTVVDYLDYPGKKKADRFEAVWLLHSFASGRRVRLKAAVPDTDPTVPSLTSIYSSANWLEREAWDMFGIGFTGHPDLRRILMYEEFSGHPLRKDYPLKEQQPRVEQIHPGVPPFGPRPKALGGG